MLRALPLSLLLLSTPCSASSCDQPAGRAIGPVVPTANAARAIYEAIAKGRNDTIRPTNDVLVNDQGDHWEVFQYTKHIAGHEWHHGIETVGVAIGDGTLELEINKCDGRMSGYYAR